jgi:hypothetical protein
MEKTAGRILRGNEVKLEGSFRLDAGQVSPGMPRERNVNLSSAQVNIVENQPEFAVIEVTCSCGAKTHIRCEYTNAQSADQA